MLALGPLRLVKAQKKETPRKQTHRPKGPDHENHGHCTLQFRQVNVRNTNSIECFCPIIIYVTVSTWAEDLEDMSEKQLVGSSQIAEELAKSALDRSPVAGLTHNFYRYPARFSPTFAATAIDLFSDPGDIVLDPYMGGGTTIVEAMVAGRRAIGTDLNSLSIFLTKVKTTELSIAETKSLTSWAEQIVSRLTYRYPVKNVAHLLTDTKKIRNLNLPRARFIKKLVAAALDSLDRLKSQHSMDFARCAVLKTSQWALDGRKSHTSLTQFRERLKQNVQEMLADLDVFAHSIRNQGPGRSHLTLIEMDAALIDQAPVFSKRNLRADLVVTSPPYPGLHVLYHRWQVDGRRETPAPYWIAGCEDGQGYSYYNFGGRRQPGLHSYFEKSLNTLRAIRRVVRLGGYMVQMLAFSDVKNHLPRYLTNMQEAGFKEVMFRSKAKQDTNHRIWRTVPNRRWHANLIGKTSGSREVVLIHKAI